VEQAKIQTTRKQLLKASKIEDIERPSIEIPHHINCLFQLITGDICPLLKNKQPGHPDYKPLK